MLNLVAVMLDQFLQVHVLTQVRRAGRPVFDRLGPDGPTCFNIAAPEQANVFKRGGA
jgi:hypothetical protein